MEIRVEAHAVRIRDRRTLRSISVCTHLDDLTASDKLRNRGIGFIDGNFAYISALWLQSLSEDRRWHDDLREILAFAEGYGWFDGVYLRAHLDSDGGVVGD